MPAWFGKEDFTVFNQKPVNKQTAVSCRLNVKARDKINVSVMSQAAFQQ